MIDAPTFHDRLFFSSILYKKGSRFSLFLASNSKQTTGIAEEAHSLIHKNDDAKTCLLLCLTCSCDSHLLHYISPTTLTSSISPSIPALPQTPVAAYPPGMNTVPLVPVSTTGAPTPATPKARTSDIAQILSKAKRFSVLIRLLKTTQLINQLNSQFLTSGSGSGSGGLALFAPPDTAFSKLKAGFLNSLNDRQKVELLQFHTLSSFVTISNFDTLTNPVQTQAGDDPKRLQLNITTYGGSQVSMSTGAVNGSVTGTVYTDNKKLAIYEVDKVLLPVDVVLPKPKAPAPSPSKEESPKRKLPAEESGDSNKNSDDDVAALVDDASAGFIPFNSVVVMWKGPLSFLGLDAMQLSLSATLFIITKSKNVCSIVFFS